MSYEPAEGQKMVGQVDCATAQLRIQDCKKVFQHFHECRITLTSVPFASSPQLLTLLNVLQAEGCFLLFAIDTIISQTSNWRLKKITP